MLEGLRGYVQLATGLTEVTASKARDAAMNESGWSNVEVGGIE